MAGLEGFAGFVAAADAAAVPRAARARQAGAAWVRIGRQKNNETRRLDHLLVLVPRAKVGVPTTLNGAPMKGRMVVMPRATRRVSCSGATPRAPNTPSSERDASNVRGSFKLCGIGTACQSASPPCHTGCVLHGTTAQVRRATTQPSACTATAPGLRRWPWLAFWQRACEVIE